MTDNPGKNDIETRVQAALDEMAAEIARLRDEQLARGLDQQAQERRLYPLWMRQPGEEQAQMARHTITGQDRQRRALMAATRIRAELPELREVPTSVLAEEIEKHVLTGYFAVSKIQAKLLLEAVQTTITGWRMHGAHLLKYVQLFKLREELEQWLSR